MGQHSVRLATSLAAVVLASSALLAPGCFSSSAEPPSLPGEDAGEDADATTTPDGPSQTPEASPLVDAGDALEASVDATIDVAPDAASEASPPGDAGDATAPVDAPADVEVDAALEAGDAGCPTTEAGVAEALCGSACVDLTTDPLNCGACSHACPAVAPSVPMCSIGRCMIALTQWANNGDFAAYIAVDSTTVTFSTTNADNPATIQQVPIGGGTTSTVIVNTGDQIGGVAVGPGTIYFSSHFQSRIESVSPDGGGNTTLTYGQSCSAYPTTWNCPGQMAVLGNDLYWAVSGPYTGSSPYIPGELLSIPATGGATSVVAADNTTNGFQMGRVVATSTGVVWNNPQEPSVLQAPFDGGALTAVVPPDAGITPQDVAADTTNVYYVNGATVAQVPRAGGPSVTLASGLSGASKVAVDSTSVYFLTTFATHDYVAKVPIGGGTVTTLAANLPNLWQLVADGTNVYVSAYTSGDTPYVLQIPAN